MTNEEKAQEIARGCFSKRTVDLPVNKLEQVIIKDACLKAMEWKEEQMIDKAVRWLNDWFTDDSCGCGIPITKAAREDFFNDFRNDMKEE